MKRKIAFGVAFAVLVAMSLAASSTDVSGTKPIGQHVTTGSPFDDQWFAAVADAETQTTNPYRPASATGTTALDVVSYTGIVVRVKYSRGVTITTDPIVCVWGYKGGDWCALYDGTGKQAITLADSTRDCDDGTTWKWTLPSGKVDCLGATKILVTIDTAAVLSGAGTAAAEVTRF